MSKMLLWLVMLPSALWRALGADSAQLRAILQAKLIEDNRKPLAFGGSKGVERKKKKQTKNTSIKTMFLSFIMGLIYIFPMILTTVDVVMGLAAFYTLFMVFLTFTLVSDFSNVLINTKDKFILFSRPINDKTIMLSRLLYIAIYLFRMVLPMSILAWVMFGIMHGWLAAIWFPIPLILVLFVVLFLVCGMYLFIMRISKPGKFKDVLGYFQIGFSIALFGSWMLSSRMMDPDKIQAIDLAMFDWARWTPPYWIAATYTWVAPATKSLPYTKLLGLLAVAFPLVSLWATIKWLAPSFIKKLAEIDTNVASSDKLNKRKIAKQKNNKLMYWLLGVFNKGEVSKAGFLITWLQTARSRSFKMKVYPAFAYVPVYFVYILMSSSKSLSEVWTTLPDRGGYIILLYMSFFVILSALGYITMSEQYKAAWVYYAAPLSRPGYVLAGAFKAMWVKFFLPFMIFIAAFVVYVWGASKILDVVLATVNITLFTVSMMIMSNRQLPFSRKEQIKESGGKSVMRMLGVFFIIGVLASLHGGVSGIASIGELLLKAGLDGFISLSFFVWLSTILKIVFLILSSLLLRMVFKELKNTDWNNIKQNEEDY